MMPVVIIAAYLIGSVPFALLLARRWGAADLRRIGSGNLGAANVLRASGVKAGVLVAVLDIAKGAASVMLAERFSGDAARPGGRRAGGDRRPHLSGVAAVSRREGRGDRVRRLLRADAARGSAGARDFRGHRLADEIHLARLGAGVARAAADRLRDGQPGAGGRRGAGGAAIIVFRHRSNLGAAAHGHRAAPRSACLMRPVTVLGAGKLGDGAGRAPRPRRSRRAPLGARSRARRRHGGAARQRRLPAGRLAARTACR